MVTISWYSFWCRYKKDEVPHVVERYNEIRTKTSFDYLNDRITYNYERTDTRYFINEDDATEYSKSGKYDYSTSKSTSNDGYPYEAKYIYCSESYCNLYEWMNSKVVEKLVMCLALIFTASS